MECKDTKMNEHAPCTGMAGCETIAFLTNTKGNHLLKDDEVSIVQEYRDNLTLSRGTLFYTQRAKIWHDGSMPLLDILDETNLSFSEEKKN